MLKSQSDEICALKATVKEMEKTLATLQKSRDTTSKQFNDIVTETKNELKKSFNEVLQQNVFSEHPPRWGPEYSYGL